MSWCAGPGSILRTANALGAGASLRCADTPIRTDAAGRYCLNDLHRASGGAGHHQPGKFFANKGTQELVSELRANSPNSESSPVDAQPGATGGTFVAKELVYAYAMWISPAFHLKVIRAYDAMQIQRLGSADAERLLFAALSARPPMFIIDRLTVGPPSCRFASSGLSCW